MSGRWSIVVTVDADLTKEGRHAIFDAVCQALEPFEKELHGRVGVSGQPVATLARTDDALTVIREALAAPHLQDDPASAAVSPRERLENRALGLYWALADAGLLNERPDDEKVALDDGCVGGHDPSLASCALRADWP